MSKTVTEMARELAEAGICPDKESNFCGAEWAERCWLAAHDEETIRAKYAEMNGEQE